MDYNMVKDNPLLRQHVIHCGRHVVLRDPNICRNRAVISISDTSQEMTEIYDVLKPLDLDIRCFKFLDVGEGEEGAIAESTAHSIVQFIEDYRESNFLVHCFIGASRSAAIAKFIVEYLGLDDSDTANLKHYNEFVYNKLKSIELR